MDLGSGSRISLPGLVVHAACLSWIWCGTASAQNRMPPLVLEEIWSAPLPEEAAVLRVATDPDGSIVLQASSGLYLWTSQHPSWTFLGSFELLDVVGLAIDDAGIELVDANTMRIARIDPEGGLSSWRRIAPDARVEAAVRSECGWIGYSPQSGELELLESSSTWKVARNIRIKDPRLGTAGRFVVVSQRDPPFAATMYDCRGVDPPVDLKFRRLSRIEDDRTLRSLPAFEVAGRIIRTLVNVSTDDRLSSRTVGMAWRRESRT